MLEATTDNKHVDVLGPSAEGMIYNVRDCVRGCMTLTLARPDGTLLLDGVRIEAAQVENGGEVWEDEWRAEVCQMPWLIRWAVNFFDRGDETRP